MRMLAYQRKIMEEPGIVVWIPWAIMTLVWTTVNFFAISIQQARWGWIHWDFLDRFDRKTMGKGSCAYWRKNSCSCGPRWSKLNEERRGSQKGWIHRGRWWKPGEQVEKLEAGTLNASTSWTVNNPWWLQDLRRGNLGAKWREADT